MQANFKVVVIAVFCIVLTACQAFSQQTKQQASPIVCNSAGAQFLGQNLILYSSVNQPKQRVYILKNISNETIWLDRSAYRLSAYDNWNSHLRAGHWSLLTTSTSEVTLKCMQIQSNGAERYFNCREVLRVCQFNHYNEVLPKGTVWLKEDVSSFND